MDKPTTGTSSAPTLFSLSDLVDSGEAVPSYQPGVFELPSPLPDGWRRLRFIDEDFFRWPGDSKPEGYGELGLATVRLLSSGKADDEIEEIIAEYSRLDSDDCPRITEHDRIEARRRLTEVYGEAEADRLLKVLEEAPTYIGPIAFDDAVELARHWLKDWPGSVDNEALRDWLVASFFTFAGGHQPPLVDGNTYRFLDTDTNLHAVRLDENIVAQCIEKAASSRIHHDALHKAGVLLLRRNWQRLGDVLSGWIADDWEGSLPSCRKRPKGSNALRDRAIVAAIKRLEAEGMTVSRNASSRPISACDAIAKATNMRVTYEAALSVWKSRER